MPRLKAEHLQPRRKRLQLPKPPNRPMPARKKHRRQSKTMNRFQSWRAAAIRYPHRKSPKSFEHQ
jgi:hypothetical protein